MPHSLSASKRLRQSEKRRLENKDRSTELKTIKKKILRAVHDQKVDEAKELFSRYTKCLDQASSRNVLHANAASRQKSRVAKVLAASAKA